MPPSLLNHLDLHGFAIAPAVMDPSTIDELRHDLDEQLPNSADAGVRALASKVESVRLVSQSPSIRSLVEPVLGDGAQVVRSIFFNKSSETNWQVGWHQDLTIAVEAKVDLAGFVSWSTKDGVPHVQPPREVLEQMLAVRLHLDAANESNGALWISPGSHRLGRLPTKEAAATSELLGRYLCSVNAGDAMLLRPLLLHASRKATAAIPRRVIHFEYARVALPLPLRWATGA